MQTSAATLDAARPAKRALPIIRVAVEAGPTSMLAAEPTSHTLFETAEWLDAVAPRAWAAATIEDNGRVIARLPYVMKSRAGLRILTVPPLTPWLGPWIAPDSGKYPTCLSREHELLRRLIGQLPRVDAAVIPAAPEQGNLLPFYWHGFDLTLGYTYRIALDAPLEAIWRGAEAKIRNRVRRAAEKLVVSVSEDIDEVGRLIVGTYWRQGLAPPSILATIARILDSPALKAHRELLIARDEAGRSHAFALLALDPRHTIYSAGGADPFLRASGAQTLLLWRAIERSHGRSAVFDFEGSMKEEIERSFRYFGAVQTPQLTAVAARTLLGRGYRLLARMRASKRGHSGSADEHA